VLLDIDSKLFPSSTIPRSKVINDLSGMPTSVIGEEVLKKGICAFELFANAGLCSTRSEARRLISQRGGYINGEPVGKYDEIIDFKHVENGSIVLRSGKKKYHRIKVE
jgi:tyrosyl-tRNA synthetase